MKESGGKTRNQISVKGELTFQVFGKDGRLKSVRKVRNLVGNFGTAHMAELLAGGSPTQIQYIALGTSNTPATITDTQLGAELYRKAASVSQGAGGDANKVEFSATWTAGDAQGTLREAGLFDAASVGNMFSRTVFADITVGAADTLVVTWDIIFNGV